MKNFIAGPATVDMFIGNQLVASANTMLDTAISLGSTAEDVRGGPGNALWGKYYHTSTFDIKLTEIMFKLEYMAMQTGSSIVSGGDIYAPPEQVTLAAGGTGSVTGTPVAFGTYGTIGWASIPNSDVWTQITFNAKAFTIAGGQAGDVYCIKYMETDPNSRHIVVSSTFVPSTARLVLTGDIYAGDYNNLSNSTKSGSVQVEVPRFQFSGAQEISMTASGVANTPMSGSALSNSSPDCGSNGYYAIITERIFGSKWYDNVFDLAVAGGEITVAKAATETLVVRAIPSIGSAFVVPNSDLTFTSKDSTKCTVSAAGVVSGVAAGSTTITVAIKNKTSVQGIAYITVPA